MSISLHRRSKKSSREAALADAATAAAALRRDAAKLRGYQRGKQDNPAEQMTTNQWAGALSR